MSDASVKLICDTIVEVVGGVCLFWFIVKVFWSK